MVSLKGSPKGIMILIEDADFNTACQQITQKLSETASFFNEDSLEVFLTSTSLTEVEVFELRPLVEQAFSSTNVVFIDTPPRLLPKQHSPLDDLKSDEGIAKFVRTKLTSGETIEYENSLVIIGDVEQGATVRCSGNLFVLGALYGNVELLKKESVVVAMKLLPQSLKIADICAQIKSTPLKKLLSAPEIAYLAGEEIKIEQYA